MIGGVTRAEHDDVSHHANADQRAQSRSAPPEQQHAPEHLGIACEGGIDRGMAHERRHEAQRRRIPIGIAESDEVGSGELQWKDLDDPVGNHEQAQPIAGCDRQPGGEAGVSSPTAIECGPSDATENCQHDEREHEDVVGSCIAADRRPEADRIDTQHMGANPGRQEIPTEAGPPGGQRAECIEREIDGGEAKCQCRR